MRIRKTVHVLSFTLIVIQVIVAQQNRPGPNAVPIPRGIAMAKKVFISYAGTNDPNRNFSGGPERCYNEFYRQIQVLNRYELVFSPADADLVLEIGLSGVPFPTRMTTSEGVAGLRILDPKTHIVLWAFYEPVMRGLLKTNDLEAAIKRIVSDLKSLATAETGAPQ